MNIRGILAGAALLLLAGGGAAHASGIVIDGKFTDWGFTNAAAGLVTTDRVDAPVTGTVGKISYAEEAGSITNRWAGYVGPGWGGAPFDIKGLYFTYDATKYYFAAVVGMPQSGTTYGGVHYVLGDILITDKSNRSYGIVTNNSYDRPTHNLAPGSFGAVVTGGINDPGFPLNNPCFANSIAGTAVATPFRYVQVKNAAGAPIPDLYFIEASVQRSLFSAPLASIHLTESCGNDVLNLTPPRIPVPEPGTMALLGSGLVGLAVLGRRKRRG